MDSAEEMAAVRTLLVADDDPEVRRIVGSAARKQGLRVMVLTASPLNRKTLKGNIAHVNLRVMGDPRDEMLISKFVETLNRDPHLRAVSQGQKANGEFTIAIDIAKQPLSEYTTHLTLPPPRVRPKENFPDGEEGGEQ